MTYITPRAGTSRRIQSAEADGEGSALAAGQECPTPEPFCALEAALADVQPAEPRVETPDEELNALIAGRIPNGPRPSTR